MITDNSAQLLSSVISATISLQTTRQASHPLRNRHYKTQHMLLLPVIEYTSLIIYIYI